MNEQRICSQSFFHVHCASFLMSFRMHCPNEDSSFAFHLISCDHTMKIRLQLIITVCIVNFEFLLVEPHDRIANQANEVNDDGEIRKKFQNLFDSVLKNDTRNFEVYRDILKEQLLNERQAFDEMRKELRIARRRNSNNKRIFGRESDDIGNTVAVKREAASKTMEFDNQTSTSKSMTLFSISLKEIERLRSLQSAVNQCIATCRRQGTTKPAVIRKIYRMNRNKTRKTWKRVTKITTIIPYVKKKTYPSMCARRIVMYWHLVKMFSGNDEEKREILLRNHSKIGGDCYIEVFTYWRRHCFYSYYDHGGIRPIQSLLSKACSVDWLNSTKIIRGLRSCCQSRFKYKKIRIF